jgi:nucleoside-diphosphate-sugar epimerase
MRDGVSLVTGAAGFVGKRLLAMLADRQMSTVAWDRRTIDLGDRQAVTAKLRELRPARIYHLASGKASVTDSDWTVPAAEAQMLTNIAYAAPSGCRIIYTGSVSEYGYSGTHRESDPRFPRSSYGFGKAIASDLAVSLSAQGIADIRVARLFNVYGPGEGPQRLVPHLVAHLLARRQVPLRSQNQTRDYVHVDDVCARLVDLAERPASPAPAVNIGTGIGVPLRMICEKVAVTLGRSTSLLTFDALPPRAIDDDFLVADTTLARAIGPVPQQHWAKGAGPAVDYIDSLRSGV